MNEKTEENINQAIDWLQETGGAIQDFAEREVPLYCQEVVKLQLAWGICGIITLVVAIVLIAVSVRCFKKDKGKAGGYFGAAMGSLIPGIVILVLSLHLIPKGIKAVAAPRVVIMEHLLDLK